MHEWYLSVRHYFFSRCTKLYSISHFKESSPKEPATLQCMLVEIQSLHFKQLITITSKATHRTLNNLLKCIGYFAIRMRFRAGLSCLNEIYFSLVERRPFAAALSTLNLFTLSPNSMTALWSGIRRTNASHRNRNNNAVAFDYDGSMWLVNSQRTKKKNWEEKIYFVYASDRS